MQARGILSFSSNLAVKKHLLIARAIDTHEYFICCLSIARYELHSLHYALCVLFIYLVYP